MMRFGFLLAVIATCGFLNCPLSRGWSDDDTPLPPPKLEPQANPKPSELMATLEETIDLREFVEPMTFGEALKHLQAILTRRGKALPVRIDLPAFREAGEGDPLDSLKFEVNCPDLLGRPSLRHILHSYLNQFPGHNGAFVIGPGHVEITTHDRTVPGSRLDVPVTLNVRGRPLFMVLDDLFEQTGVSIIVDARYAQRVRIPVSATIAAPVSLRDALHIVCDMAELRLVPIGAAVYVTSPQNAYRLYWEQQSREWRMFDPRSLDF